MTDNDTQELTRIADALEGISATLTGLAILLDDHFDREDA